MNFIRQLAARGRISFPVSNGVFTVRRWPTLMTLLVLAVLIALGSWQVQRLHWKEHLLAEIAQRTRELPQDVRSLSPLYWHADGRAESRIAVADLDYRPASAIGQFLYGGEMFLLKPSLTGQGGYHVLTPMQLEDGRWLLVDRGWIPYNRRPDLAANRKAGYARPAGIVQVAGILRLPAHRWLQPANKPAQGEWYGIDLAAMAQAAGIPGFLPFVLEADSDPNSGGFPVGGQTRLDLPNNHLSYILTWYGLAIVLLVIYAVAGWKRNKPAKTEEAADKPVAEAAPEPEKPVGPRKASRAGISEWIALLFAVPEPTKPPAFPRRIVVPAPEVVAPAVPAPAEVIEAPAEPAVSKPRRARRKKAAAEGLPDSAAESAPAEAPVDVAVSPETPEAAPAKPVRKRRKKTATPEPEAAPPENIPENAEVPAEPAAVESASAESAEIQPEPAPLETATEPAAEMIPVLPVKKRRARKKPEGEASPVESAPETPPEAETPAPETPEKPE